jgi:hypothetical protein
LTQGLANRVPDFRSPRVGPDEFGNAEMGLKLEHPARRSFGFIRAAEARQSGGAQDDGETETRV